MESSLTNELLQAMLSATEEQKQGALRVLKGTPVGEVQPRESEPFLDAGGVAKILKVHCTTLWKWRVPGHRWAGRPRYRMSEVLAYLESEAFRNRVRELKAMRRRTRRQVRPDGKES